MTKVVVLKAVHFVGVGVYHEVSAVLPASVQAVDKMTNQRLLPDSPPITGHLAKD